MEIGGYISLELDNSNEYYNNSEEYNVARFNSGRAGIVAALDSCIINKIYIPYYNCNVVEEILLERGYSVIKYKIDRDFLPVLGEIGEKEWIIYVDYWGINYCNKERIIRKFKNVIFDNTQAFFSKPIISKNVFNVYSCRKFFGVSDGSYVISGKENSITKEYNRDVSWERSSYLLKSIELGTNGAYVDSLESEKSLGCEVKEMSFLTQKIMRSINYDRVKDKRKNNYNYLIDMLGGVNELSLNKCDNNPPMVYPLLVKDCNLRYKLINERIYVPQWWKYLIDLLDSDDYEVYLSKYLLPLPIDQRYSVDDMRIMGSFVLRNLEGL